ncbi:hypothetical protein PoB_006605500 [Plakobranchus ocellatus]|uniref:Uncharacterized protein n=1 Tax=Plakobranchus ocellatus TaxID=259542 RepID=A0AAV4D5X7_9GAST|nr:hypothetical protein PoB_006605500 [Plakobranchus ocellatus]
MEDEVMKNIPWKRREEKNQQQAGDEDLSSGGCEGSQEPPSFHELLLEFSIPVSSPVATASTSTAACTSKGYNLSEVSSAKRKELLKIKE